MKSIAAILLITLIESFGAVLAQAPQGVNYQAIALDGSGNPVANQPVSIRLSILDGSATGTVVYSETQNPSTDNTGLFSIVIGNGTIVSGTFNTINWGNGTKWLKTEIDITGGTTYVLMGSSQFMSAPYALYANKTGFSSGSFTIPDGFDNATTVVLPFNADYTVPTGKNLYLSGAEHFLTIDGDTLYASSITGGTDASNFIGASENSIVNFKVRNWNTLPVTAFLVNKKVQWQTFSLADGPFTVPNNKQFVVVNISNIAGSGGFVFRPFTISSQVLPTCTFTVNGIATYFEGNTILSPGTIVSVACTSGFSAAEYYFTVNGYLMDRQ